MFDAKSLLNALVSAGSQMAQKAAQPTQPGKAGGVGGLLGSVLGQISQVSQGAAGTAPTAGGGHGGIVGSVLGKLQQGAQGAAQQAGGMAGQAGQAATGAFDKLQGRLAGTQAGDLLNRARELAGQNQMATGAALGGLAALVLGSKTGRSVVGSAAAMGGLALIGGLAYKAYQNHQAGQPVPGQAQAAALPAPAGSGFEPEAASNETAILLIRAMIAAAASDGLIDATERQAIVGGLAEAGFDPEGNAWLEHEMANPARLADLAAGAATPELAAQVYTAARLAIEPDTQPEADFLAGLGQSLGLDPGLVGQIDLAAASVKA
ncbi:MAG: tellurite resistance TerB family protein [Bosea sp.]|jgi:uncharacterized membrane protein YebE (DUF533 family)|nr:tellurite resistance TerB family protein [Bosea sp. (in: a-proteobacteria)]